MKKLLLLFSSLLLINSCATSAKFLSDNYSKPKRIALLPTINQTTDVEGGIVFRNLLYFQMADLKYTEVLRNDIVDSLLNLEGITNGGQLSTITNADLAGLLNVDGLLYVNLVECEFQTIGISETRLIKANLKLFQSSGVLIWEDERKIDNGSSIIGAAFGSASNRRNIIGKVVKDFGEQLVDKSMKMWLLEHELRPEMQESIQMMLLSLP